MIKKLFTFILLLSAFVATAQNNTASPYSYFGIGEPTFNGTAENRALQGLSVNADSLHYNFQNPASLGSLKLTTFSVGMSQSYNTVKDNNIQETAQTTSFDYLAIGLPLGKLNVGFGLLPKTTVGYKIQDLTDESLSQFEGHGGLSNLFIALGYDVTKGLRIGIEGSYNFGNIHNETQFFQDDIQYGTREKNRSTLSGLDLNIGAQYDVKLKKDLNLYSSVNFSPKTRLKSKNKRDLAAIVQTSDGGVTPVNEEEVNLSDTHFDLPTSYRIGAGIGSFQKWFVGLEYENIGKTTYTNTSFSMSNVAFKNANVYRLGGFYIPNYNDITNYFNRITFRAGARYQEMGMNINGKDIDEFGISFGLGLPAGQNFSTINLGVEYGQRGTNAAGLVKEDFVNIFVGISLNDKWFVKRKYR